MSGSARSRSAGDGDDPDGAEPLPGAVDARFTLAAERTVLAWLRTALGLIAAGVAVMHLIDPLGGNARIALGTTLLAMGVFTALAGAVRWHEINRALRHGGPLPGPWPIWVLTALVVAAAIGFAFWT